MTAAVANPNFRIGVCRACGRYGQIATESGTCAAIESADQIGSIVVSKRVAACKRRSEKSRAGSPVVSVHPATDSDGQVIAPAPVPQDTTAGAATPAVAEGAAVPARIEGS